MEADRSQREISGWKSWFENLAQGIENSLLSSSLRAKIRNYKRLYRFHSTCPGANTSWVQSCIAPVVAY